MAVALTPCAYCGMPADTVDHVVPRAKRGYVTFDWRRLPDTVPACRECNSIASDVIVRRSVRAKRRAIQAALRRRYKSLLATPDHTEADLRALGYVLRVQVEASLARRDLIRERLAWPGLPPTITPSTERAISTYGEPKPANRRPVALSAARESRREAALRLTRHCDGCGRGQNPHLVYDQWTCQYCGHNNDDRDEYWKEVEAFSVAESVAESDYLTNRLRSSSVVGGREIVADLDWE